MKLDFDIVSQGGSLDFEIKNTKTINASGGIGEDVVREIIAEETANLQPKRDEALKTQSKEIVEAINELHEREDKQGLTEEQVKEVVRETAVTQESDPTVPNWAKEPNKPTYTAEEVGALPSDTPLFSGSYNDLTDKPEEKKEIVLVDVAELIMTNNIDKFNDLSQQALNGEIAIFVKLEGSVYAVNYIHEGGESYTWTFVGAEYYQMEANPTSAIIIGKLLIINGAFEPFMEHVDLGEFLKAADTSQIVKEGLTNSEETFTDDEKQSARDLIGAVGVNNYAKPDGKTYGIVRAESWSPVTVDNNGTLIANVATDADIADRYRHRLLRCSDIDKAVKAGVTTNTEELTDDEKTSACDWVGAVTRKPNESNGWRRVYGMDANGNENIYAVSEGTEVYSIPVRGVGGVVSVGTPTRDIHATPKSYVDGLVGDINNLLEAILGV